MFHAIEQIAFVRLETGDDFAGADGSDAVLAEVKFSFSQLRY